MLLKNGGRCVHDKDEKIYEEYRYGADDEVVDAGNDDESDMGMLGRRIVDDGEDIRR